MPKLLKQALAITLSVMLIVISALAPAYAFAPPDGGYDWVDKQYGKWTKDLRDPTTGAIKSGVQVTAKDSRGFISKIIKNPSAGRIAQRLAKGANSVSIALALADLGFEAVDWVLDPENNSVRIKGDGTGYYVTNGVCKTLAASPELSCQLATKFYSPNLHYGLKNGRYVCSGYNNGTWTAPNYDFDVSKNKRCPTSDVEIPLDEIARKLQEISETGTGQKQLDAQKVIEETVEEMGEAGELDAELDAALQPDSNPCQTGYKPSVTTGKCVPETTTETDPKPEAEPQPLKLPAFCQWTGMCPEWLKTRENTEKTSKNTEEMKEQDKTFYQTVTEFFDFMQFEDIEKDDDTEIEPEEPELPVNSVNVNFSKTCPADKQIPFSLVGKQMNIVLSYANICEMAFNLSWLVKVLSTLMAAYILTGIRS